jgi:VWFA-related protein
MRKALLYMIAVLTLTPAVFAQPVSEAIEVRVANVDVVVTDRDGHPIHGLTKDDFELYENKKLQPITNFFEVRGETPAIEAGGANAPAAPSAAAVPAPAFEAPPRSIVVFIDDTSIDPLRRNEAINVIERALTTMLRPGDDAMIVSWNQQTEVLQQFTADRAELSAALAKARKFTTSVNTIPWQRNEAVSFANTMIAAVQEGKMSVREAYSGSVGKARAYAEFILSTERALLKTMIQSIRLLSGVEGKKVFIFVGGELQERPGLDVFQLIDRLFVGMIRTAPPIIRESDINTTDDLREVSRAANANGVSLYMIDVADRSRSAAGGSLQMPPDTEIEFTQQANTYFSMGRLAWNTGGTVLSGSTNYTVALSNIARDLGSYYSLGYKPSATAGVDRAVSVKVKRPGAVVRTRGALALKSTDDQMQDRVIANAFHTTLKGDFPVKVDASAPEPFEKGLFKVKVTLTFPSTLTYLPDGENLSGEYTAFFVTAAPDGSVSAVAKQGQQVNFPANALESVKQNPFTHTTGLILRSGTQSISVAILDKFGARIGYGRTTVTAR